MAEHPVNELTVVNMDHILPHAVSLKHNPESTLNFNTHTDCHSMNGITFPVWSPRNRKQRKHIKDVSSSCLYLKEKQTRFIKNLCFSGRVATGLVVL